MNCEAFLSLLQFSDGLFPAGSYAHSFGLESYTTDGTVRDSKAVECFLVSYLQGSLAPTDVIATLASRKAALSERPFHMEHCVTIDHQVDAMKSASELREASRQMGRQVFRIAANLSGPMVLDGLLIDLFHAIEKGETPGHHAVAFGTVSTAFEWPEAEIACAYLYSTCAGLTAAALRLLPLGQLAGQQILWAVAPVISRLVEEVQGKGMSDIWSFTPGIEIAAMRHATLDARLFRS